MLFPHQVVSGVSVSFMECVQRKGWYSESHLSAAVCTEVRGSTPGMQCPHMPVCTWRDEADGCTHAGKKLDELY